MNDHRLRFFAVLAALSFPLAACSEGGNPPTGSSTGAGGDLTSGSGGAAQGTGGNVTGTGGGTDLESLLARLRADRDGTLLEESYAHGWPVAVAEGRVVVSTDPGLDQVAGDFDDWTGTPLTADQGFAYAILPDVAGEKYKLKGGATFVSDPWSRGYDYDTFGEISLVAPSGKRFDRFFEVTDVSTTLEPRTVRILVPAATPTHLLFVHDGQNLFDPDAIWGGWKLADSAPAGMMIVGVDNTSARMDEYTQVPDDIGSGPIGGLGDAYADYVEDIVRPLVAAQYGEAPKVGVMGSSLGGLISLHEGYRFPDRYDFVASLSGTLGWGSIDPGVHNETMIERYDAVGTMPFVVYLDSGGNGPCADTDMDGIDDDDPSSADNYCETAQMRDTMLADGWVIDQNLFHWHEAGAEHNEAAWAARVFRPLGIFAAL